MIDKEYKILRRNKLVDLNLPSDAFGEEKETADFISKINVRIDKASEEDTDQEPLKKIVEGLREFGGEQTLTYRDIEKRRQDFNFYKENLKLEDTLSQTADIILANETKFEIKSPCPLTNTPSA